MTQRKFREQEVQIARYRVLEREVTDPLAACLLHVIVEELEADLARSAAGEDNPRSPVAGNKADRLELLRRDTLRDAEKIDVAFVPHVQQGPPSNHPALQKLAGLQTNPIVSRPWHDSHALKSIGAAKRKTSSSTHRRPAGRESTQFSDQECRSDGLDPLLRKLNLSPPCKQ